MAFLKSASREDTGVVLYGRRIFLCAPQMSDYQQWAQLRRESEHFLRPFEPGWAANELTKRSFRQRLDYYQRSQRDGSAYAFFLKSRDDDRLLGGLTLSNVRYGVISSTAIGYWLGEAYTRQGYMSEAVESALSFSFDTLALHRVEAACVPQNKASVALLDKSGFAREGLARKYLKINGVWQDHLLFALLEEDY